MKETKTDLSFCMKNHQFDFNQFITYLKRLVKTGYKELALYHNSFINCYSLDEDDDIGMHVKIPIDSDKEFYNMSLLIRPNYILNQIKPTIDKFNKYRKDQKIKPKCAKIIGTGVRKKSAYFVDVGYYLYRNDTWELFTFDTLEFPYLHHNDKIIQNINETKRLRDLRCQGDWHTFDAIEKDIINKTISYSRVYYHMVDINGSEVPLPFLKSFFHGINKPDKFIIRIKKTIIPNVYFMEYHFEAKGITEIYSMYVENFRV